MNSDIKQKIKEARLYQWEVANALGMSETTFTKMLRHTMPETRKEKILNIIQAHKEGKRI